MILENPIPIRLERLAPEPGLFAHASEIHGQKHVARVMILGFLLLDRLRLAEDAARLWAATYLHDLGRTHDGRCYEHGKLSLERLETMPELRSLFAEGGVVETDYEEIKAAVTHHCLPQELPRDHPRWQLTALLKDSDGLDRVRLGDLDPDYLRFDASRELVPFAQVLYDKTQWNIATGPEYMARLWPIARELASIY